MGLVQVNNQITEINKFITIFDKKVETIIVELKKRTYALINNVVIEEISNEN